MSEENVLKEMANFKRELRKLSKNDLIRSYVGQYAQTVRLTVLVEKLQEELKKAKQPESKGE